MAKCDTNGTRRVPLEFAKDGNPKFTSVCSPEDFKPNALCIAPPRHVIPVIFVPGVMGTNLKSSKTAEEPGSKSWTPPNSVWGGLSEARQRSKQKPADRQRQLNPNTTEVDDSGKVSIPKTLFTLTEEEARRRGWGEIHWDGYGKVLMELEVMLNDQYEECGTKYAKQLPAWKLAQAIKEETHTKHWGSKGDARDLTQDEFTRLDDYYYPVWACGYNWMQSNEQSAQTLEKRIDEVLAWYRKAAWFVPEGRVIIVTHSMGGLVTRRCIQLRGMQDKILGVVHGVQPVMGAPVVYRRFRAGTENDGFFDIVGKMVALVMGWSAADTTCIYAHSPGILELLPTKDYPKEWLKVKNGEETLASLPKDDPYSEIYATKVQDVWWGMVDETLIDPAGLVKDKTPFKAFTDSLEDAKTFHDKIGLKFHPNTYAHYGTDTDKNSFLNVCWEAETGFERRQPTISTQQVSELMQAQAQAGSVTTRGACRVELKGEQIGFKFAGKDGGGDATVPEPSSAIVDKAGLKATFRMTGFVHALSYNDRHVLDNTAYCIGRIVQDATPAKQLPQKGKLCSPADYAAALSATSDPSSLSPSSASPQTATQPQTAP